MLKRNWLLLISIAFILLLSSFAFCESRKNYAGEFVSWGRDIRHRAMGIKGVAVPGITQADTYNFSLAGFYNNTTFSAQYSSLFWDDYVTAFAFQSPWKREDTTVGFSFVRMSHPDIEYYDGPSKVDYKGLKEINETYASVKFVKTYDDAEAGFGINIGYFREDLIIEEQSSFVVDSSYYKWLGDEVLFGAVFNNLFFGELGEVAIRPEHTFGFSWFSPYGLLLSGEFVHFGEIMDTNIEFNYGLEYSVFDFVFLRAGMMDDEFSTGVGFSFGGFGIDYAYQPNEALGNTSHSSVSFIF